jgi:hypothetical protein
MGNIINYYWNSTTRTSVQVQESHDVVTTQPTPDTRAFLTQAQDNISVSPLIPIENKSETPSSIHNPETPIELSLVTTLNDLDSQKRDHIDHHYVSMLKSKPLHRYRIHPSTRSNRSGILPLI